MNTTEVRKEVRTYSVRLMCGNCNGGEMHPTGATLLTSPPQYPHKCLRCNKESVERKRYPFTEYKSD